MTKIMNFNVGVMGHIDSGKTSLAKALSTTKSTACFDKNPQSKERGITLDLGFSSFILPAPSHISNNETSKQEPQKCKDATETAKNPTTNGITDIQFTLVDCPGHASLIRTIIGGAQIVDLMMLVVDVNKGFQTQTAECLVISEIMSSRMVVVMNKIDLIKKSERQMVVDKMKKRILKTLEKTKFKNSPIVPTSADPDNLLGIDELKEILLSQSFIPQRSAIGPFLFALDHCFLIKGQGTVMTGTVLSGSVSVNDSVEIMKEVKKVKSIQMYKKAVQTAMQGDRVGVCVVGLEAKNIERGLLSTPGFLISSCHLVARVHKVSYFRSKMASKAGKIHVTLGHETQMATCVFFKGGKEFNIDEDYGYIEELKNDDEEEEEERQGSEKMCNYVHLKLDKATLMHKGMLVVASKLDSDLHTNQCRLAFYGGVVCVLGDEGGKSAGDGAHSVSHLKVYKVKSKEGTVERKMDEYTVVVKDLFRKESNIGMFTGLKVRLASGEEGVIEGHFGQSGKIKVHIQDGLKSETSEKLNTTKKNKKAVNNETNVEKEEIKVMLRFKKYIYQPNKKLVGL